MANKKMELKVMRRYRDVIICEKENEDNKIVVNRELIGCYFPGGEFRCESREAAEAEYIIDLMEDITDTFHGAENTGAIATEAAYDALCLISDAWSQYEDEHGRKEVK